MSHRQNPSSLGIDDKELVKTFKEVYETMKKDDAIQQRIKKLKPGQKENAFPETCQEFFSIVNKKLGINMKETCQELKDDTSVPKNYKILPSSSCNDNKHTKTSNENATNADDSVSEFVQYFIENMKKVDKKCGLSTKNDVVVKDSPMKLPKEAQDWIDKKDDEVPVFKNLDSAEQLQNLSSSSSNDNNLTKITNKNDEPVSGLVQYWIDNLKKVEEKDVIAKDSEMKKVEDRTDKQGKDVSQLPENLDSLKLQNQEPNRSFLRKPVIKLPRLAHNKKGTNEKLPNACDNKAKNSEPLKHSKDLKYGENKENVEEPPKQSESDRIPLPTHKKINTEVQRNQTENSKDVELKEILKELGYDESYQKYQERREEEVKEMQKLRLEVQKKNERIAELMKNLTDSASENLQLKKEISKMSSHMLDLQWQNDLLLFNGEQQNQKENQKKADESATKYAKIDDLEEKLKEKTQENEELNLAIRNLIVSDREASKMVDKYYRNKMEEDKLMNSDRIDKLTDQIEKLVKSVEELKK